MKITDLYNAMQPLTDAQYGHLRDEGFTQEELKNKSLSFYTKHIQKDTIAKNSPLLEKQKIYLTSLLKDKNLLTEDSFDNATYMQSIVVIRYMEENDERYLKYIHNLNQAKTTMKKKRQNKN